MKVFVELLKHTPKTGGSFNQRIEGSNTPAPACQESTNHNEQQQSPPTETIQPGKLNIPTPK